MNVINIARCTASILFFKMILLASSNASAFNRNDVFFELDKLNESWNDLSLDMWINNFENDPDPGVKIGDTIVYHVKAGEPAFFVFVLVDAKGQTAILKPDALTASGNSEASSSLTFPTIDGSNGAQNYIVQAEPLGRETIYLIASIKPLPNSLFDIDAQSDYANYGTDLDKVQDLVARLNGYSDSMGLAVHTYQYYVDADTQFTTRGIRRAVSERVQELGVTTDKPRISVAVRDDATKIGTDSTLPDKPAITEQSPEQSSPIVINDINFKSGSDVLTSTGISQLEILGSELIDRQAKNQLPGVLLTGHTDSVGSAEYNLDLSERRSRSAKRFLVENLGLPGEYIDTLGMGESEPIDSNETVSGRARNRRVEFVVMQ